MYCHQVLYGQKSNLFLQNLNRISVKRRLLQAVLHCNSLVFKLRNFQTSHEKVWKSGVDTSRRLSFWKNVSVFSEFLCKTKSTRSRGYAQTKLRSRRITLTIAQRPHNLFLHDVVSSSGWDVYPPVYSQEIFAWSRICSSLILGSNRENELKKWFGAGSVPIGFIQSCLRCETRCKFRRRVAHLGMYVSGLACSCSERAILIRIPF